MAGIAQHVRGACPRGPAADLVRHKQVQDEVGVEEHIDHALQPEPNALGRHVEALRGQKARAGKEGGARAALPAGGRGGCGRACPPLVRFQGNRCRPHAGEGLRPAGRNPKAPQCVAYSPRAAASPR